MEARETRVTVGTVHASLPEEVLPIWYKLVEERDEFVRLNARQKWVAQFHAKRGERCSIRPFTAEYILACFRTTICLESRNQNFPEKETNALFAPLLRPLITEKLGLQSGGMAKRPESEELKRTAYHEAGHAVLAIILPFMEEIASVTIVPAGEYRGTVRWQTSCYSAAPRTRAEKRTWAEAQIAMFLAGEMAAIVGSGFSDGGPEDKDHTHARQLAETVYEDWSVRVKFLELCQARAEALIREHWKKVDALAIALLRRKTLTGKQVKMVIARVH
ncbi:MAG: hypothetical protein AB1640_07245 [bacterium]